MQRRTFLGLTALSTFSVAAPAVVRAQGKRFEGVTLNLFVTHDQEEALMLSDRIAVMNRGRIEQISTPENIYERPATRFVAEFIGRCSILEGRANGGHFVSKAGLRLPAS